MRIWVLTFALLFFSNIMSSQNLEKDFSDFKKQIEKDYSTFRDECNKKYIEFLKSSWDWYTGEKPIPMPMDDLTIPPRPYIEKDNLSHNTVQPIDIKPLDEGTQPKPIEPIREIQDHEQNYFSFPFYGITAVVRLPEYARLDLKDISRESLAIGWGILCSDEMNNTIRDCLETRIRYNLCDWAYLMFLDQLAQKYCDNSNGATLLTAFLYSQSGYQMRLAIDGTKLVLLYGSKHQIYDKGYFDIDGISFYPLNEPSKSISICGAEFERETPMSLIIEKEQLLGADMSEERTIQSKNNKGLNVVSQVPQKLIEFYNTYPTSAIDGNPMTRWAMYANTPLAQVTKDKLYPSLRKSIAGCDKLQAAEILLNWVQTGFEYEYDDKVWGHDRAFFSEETLYYPYGDCEDRSILFSRLIRDLLGLDVALIFYPGHLATAVYFNQDVEGDAMIIGGRKFIVCDPTYIGAPVGVQMPDLEYDKAQAIVLKR